MVKKKCQHCGKVWEYGGCQEYYATCPNCRYKVPLNWTQEQFEEIKKYREQLDIEKSTI